VNPKYIAPYMLRSYIWDVLKANTSLTEADYSLTHDASKGLIPIVPLAEEPEISQFDKPYIVYGYSESPTADVYAMRRGNMAFIIYSTNFREISQIANIITTTFDRADDAAKDVNAYTTAVPDYRGLRFGYVQVSFVEGGSPEEAPSSEGGRQSAAVNIRYEYYVDYDINTTPTPTTPA
jgi:hypothetical protein